MRDHDPQDLPLKTLRRQLDSAYLALQALDDDRLRVITERDNLRVECEQLKRELQLRSGFRMLLRAFSGRFR